MAKRIVRHALFSYRNADGVKLTAFRGQEIDLDGKELERAERLQAVVEGELKEPMVLTVVEPLTPDVVLPVETPVEVEKPAAEVIPTQSSEPPKPPAKPPVRPKSPAPPA